MLEDGAHKEILEDDYERHRQLAEKFRERKEPAKAAEHYRKTAEIVDQIADLESAEKLAEKRRSLAKNLDEAADTLEAIASGEVSVVDGESETTAEFSDDRSGTQSGGPEPGGTANASPPGGTGNGDENKEVDAKAYLKDPPELDFDDVGGMTDLKQTVIDTIVDPLERPDLYEEYGLGVVNGVLLYGPPGTGKTYITQALAGKLGYNFIEVTPSDLSSSLVGEAADNVAELFTVARENQPCLVFIDEIDAIAGQRTGGAQTTQSQQQMVNQLLTELSDVQGEDVVVFAATNLLELSMTLSSALAGSTSELRYRHRTRPHAKPSCAFISVIGRSSLRRLTGTKS